MVVHFWGPNFWTSLIRYSSSYEVQDRFFPEWGHEYICYSCLQGCSSHSLLYADGGSGFIPRSPSFKFKYWRKHFILNLENLLQHNPSRSNLFSPLFLTFYSQNLTPFVFFLCILFLKIPSVNLYLETDDHTDTEFRWRRVHWRVDRSGSLGYCLWSRG